MTHRRHQVWTRAAAEVRERSAAQEPEDAADSEAMILAFPARIVLVDEERAPSALLPGDDELLRLARQRATDPSIFEESPPFFFPAEISSNRLDSYSSRMMPSSLQNYAQDATDGISFQNSHISRELPLGSSLAGKYIGPGGNGVARTLAAFYTIPDLQMTGTNTTQFIRGIRSGIVKDVSIGFYGGRSECSICGGNMWSWMECEHWPGDMYEVDGKEVMAVELIHDARLAEVSAVYDGACPGAAITKAVQVMEMGLLEPEKARVLEARYRIKLPGARHLFSGNRGEKEMSTNANETDEQRATREAAEAAAAEEARVAAEAAAAEEAQRAAAAAEEARLAEEAAQRARETLAATTITPEQRTQLTADLARLTAEIERVGRENTRLSEENTRLVPLAEDGRTYRADLIEDTIKEGIRAMKDNFPVETQRAVLGGCTIEQIKQIRKGYTADGDKRWPGGRLSRDEGDEPESQRETGEYVDLTPSTRAFKNV